MLAEFNHVEVRRCSDPIDKDQLMLGPIKRSHPGIGLVPDAEVQALAVNGRAGCRDVVHMPPVHANEMDSAIARDTCRRTERVGEKGPKLRLAHLTGGHGEFAVLSARTPPNIDRI